MSTAVWVIMILGTLAIAGNLVNGYLQRKQMRQNELFRQDRSVGLTPPSTPFKVSSMEIQVALLEWWNERLFSARGTSLSGAFDTFFGF